MISVNYDLHAHSTASDGTLKPAELVQLAVTQGVAVLALTDHDTLAGVDEARRSALKTSLELIAGVEVSAVWERQVVHLVGLNVDTDNSRLCEGLHGIAMHRDERARRIGERLAKCGVENAYRGARKIAGNGAIARPHFARFLVQQNVVADTQTAFKKYLVKNRPAYVGGDWATFSDAIAWIRAAGGQAIIAHPARYRMTRSKLRRLFAEFISLGGEGIEVVSGAHSLEENRLMAGHARDLGLAASVGSDFHGLDRPRSMLGRLAPLPDGVRPIWEKWG